MPLPVNDAGALPSHASDETDMDEDFSLGSVTLGATVSAHEAGTVVSQRRIGLHR